MLWLLEGLWVYVCWLVCLLFLFRFCELDFGFPSCVFFVCVCVCACLLRMLPRQGKWGVVYCLEQPSMVFVKKEGPLHLLMCPPLHSCAASPQAHAGLCVWLMVSKYDRHTQQSVPSKLRFILYHFMCFSLHFMTLYPHLFPFILQKKPHDILSGKKHRQLKGLFRAARALGPAGPPCQEGYSTGNTIHDTHTLGMHPHTHLRLRQTHKQTQHMNLQAGLAASSVRGAAPLRAYSPKQQEKNPSPLIEISIYVSSSNGPGLKMQTWHLIRYTQYYWHNIGICR